MRITGVVHRRKGRGLIDGIVINGHNRERIDFGFVSFLYANLYAKQLKQQIQLIGVDDVL
ncbi:MAG: hypothetical protein D6737_10130 [Chloroflexi bacterium]|nr:MAG: hypothetical protein D6737_10130 [Chloroflexota bacterium]